MLAHMLQEELEGVIPQMEFRRLTANTISEPAELRRHLQRVRKNGYAFDLEEHEAHIRCVAAPIWDPNGAVNASLSLTAPVVRMGLPRLRQLAPLLQEAGLRISRELGYQGTGYPQSRNSTERQARAGRASSARTQAQAISR